MEGRSAIYFSWKEKQMNDEMMSWPWSDTWIDIGGGGWGFCVTWWLADDR